MDDSALLRGAGLWGFLRYSFARDVANLWASITIIMILLITTMNNTNTSTKNNSDNRTNNHNNKNKTIIHKNTSTNH